MNVIYRSIRGMHDLLPLDTYYLSVIENMIKKVLNSYAYFEMRFPIVEKTELFKKAIGNDADIMQKEMYNFYDKRQKEISLRPEGTVSCIRSCVQNNLFYNSKIQKLWYHGPMFRYERPQKGRFRQFYQLGIEHFGSKNLIIDYEVIVLTINILKKLNLLKYLKLEINSIGCIKDRRNFALDLKNFFQKHLIKLTEYEKKILSINPIRILDSKNNNVMQLLKSAPVLFNYLNKSSYIRFEKLCHLLNRSHIDYTINYQLVRGLDYYNDTVFEWKTNILGSQNTICAGGRYDNLVEYLGGKKNPAIGCAFGMDRLLILKKLVSDCIPKILLIDINIVFLNSVYSAFAIQISEKLHLIWPNLIINTCLKSIQSNNYNKYSKQIKAKFLLILNSNLLRINKILVKNIFKNTNKIFSLHRIFQNPCIFID